MAPGSFLWLVAHDIRLNWRRFADMVGGLSTIGIFGLLAAGTIALHIVAWPAFIFIQPHVVGDASTPLNVALLCIFTWMIAQGLFGITRTLYDRGDLDLLLGAPLPPWRILAAKAVAVATSTLGSIGLLVLPLANVAALLDSPKWLAAYPLLIALVLIATSFGVALSIALFFLLGPRRGRLYAQMTGALIAGGFVLGAQVITLLPDHWRAVLAASFERGSSQSWLQAAILVPSAALRGDASALVLLLGIGLAVSAVAVIILGRHFAGAARAATGAPSEERSDRRHRVAFRGGLASSLRRKEWRLLTRDPNLFAQLGLQIVYTIPIAVVLLRSDTLPTALALAPAIVVIAAQVSASLAWLMVSGEDAPELMAAAPVPAVAIDRAKLSAVAVPVFVIVGLPLVGLALASWRAAIVTAAFATAGATSTALLNFWHPMPGSRRGMLRRHSQSKLIALIEHALAILWAIAIVLALVGSAFALLPIALVAGILIVLWRRHHRAEGAPLGTRRVVPAPQTPVRA